jgi:translation initiation factor IF-2
MSKKELLDRISRSPERVVRRSEPVVAAPAPAPVAPAPAAAPAAAADAVITRVSSGVVRRRQQPSAPEPAVSETVVVRRRQAVDLGRREESSAPVEPVRAREPERAPPVERRVEVSAPAIESDVAPKATAEVSSPESAPPVEVERAPEVRAVEPKAESRAGEARPAEVRPEPEAKVPPRRREVVDTGPSFSARPTDVAPPEPVDRSLPDRPKFEGLGRAVVMPPPGYDPTNPSTFRRRPTPPPAARPSQPAAPAGPDAGPYGRRRAYEGGGESQEDAERRRRGRSAAPAGDTMGMRRRPRRKVMGQKASSPGPKASKRKIRIDNVISVGQLAHELGVKASVVIKELMGMGRMATVNEMLDLDTAGLVASEFEYEVENVGFQEHNFLQHVADEVEEEGMQDRPPVVTIMGHVDHGKTTLLDAIRAAKVAAGEAGGITQHIGAYQVESDGRPVTFIDTPGHAAFTAMRARGAGVTDIVVLVVAADDGVQAQTEEAISHAKAAGVPIVVAVNKMDKAGVSPDPIKQRLSDYGLVPEDWGGETMYVPVSALKKQGIDALLEAILLQAEVLELQANPERHAEGTVIEARLERGRGAVATLLVQRGTMKRGDNVVLGSAFGRVRAMLDHTGKQLKEAGPSTPVEIFGLSEVPEVGDTVNVVKSEKDARTLAEHRAAEKRALALTQSGRRTAADLFAQSESPEKKTLNLVLKADVGGSLEALKGALHQISVEGTDLRILHAAVGDISESDVNLAAANNALLVGFGVRVDAMGRAAAEQQGVEPELYDIIYAVIDKVTALMSGLLGPQYHEVRQGTVEVRAVFNISKFGRIAGCYVSDGKVGRNHTARLFRDGQKVWEGRVKTLKRFKDDVRDVAAGYECGIGLDGFDDIQQGDILETYTQEEKKV